MHALVERVVGCIIGGRERGLRLLWCPILHFEDSIHGHVGCSESATGGMKVKIRESQIQGRSGNQNVFKYCTVKSDAGMQSGHGDKVYIMTSQIGQFR